MTDTNRIPDPPSDSIPDPISDAVSQASGRSRPGAWEPPRLLSAERVLHSIAAELAAGFAGVFSAGTVNRYVAESYELLAAQAAVTTHLPNLARRFAAERLRACAQARGELVKDVPEVLFVCVHNAGRSQMAAALLHHHAQGRVHVRSAGSAPVDTINPAVIEVMTELGLDLSKEFPKPLTDEVVQAADAIVTMGCGDACPVYPGKRYLDWELADPHDQDLGTVRAIRDDINSRVQALLDDLLPTPAAAAPTAEVPDASGANAGGQPTRSWYAGYRSM